MGSQISRFILFVVYASMDMHAWQETQRFIDEDGPPNLELTKKVFPYAKVLIITFNLGRLVLFLIGLKWLKITRIFFYYELITFVIEQMLPFDITWTVATLIRLLISSLNLITDYFDWWPSLFCTLLQYPILGVARAMFYNESIDSHFFLNITSTMVVSALFSWIIHISIVKFNLIYIEAEVLREGNEQLLNNLEEGVIIVEEAN